MDKKTVAIGGHRGNGCTDAPFFQKVRQSAALPVENTVESVEAAYALGCDYIETDAVMTADGVVLALHNVVPADHFFMDERPAQPINQLSYQDVARYKTGPAGTGRPTPLADLLAIAARHDKHILPWAINVEIKGVQRTPQAYETNDFIERTAAVLRNSGITEERLLLSSFSLKNMIRMSHLLPRAQYAMLFKERHDQVALYGDGQDDWTKRYLPYDRDRAVWAVAEWKAQAAPSARMGYFHPETACCGPEGVAIARDLGMGLNVWAFFEEMTPERRAFYDDMISNCAAEHVPLTIITDYIADFKGA